MVVQCHMDYKHDRTIYLKMTIESLLNANADHLTLTPKPQHYYTEKEFLEAASIYDNQTKKLEFIISELKEELSNLL